MSIVGKKGPIKVLKLVLKLDTLVGVNVIRNQVRLEYPYLLLLDHTINIILTLSLSHSLTPSL